jgi:hypothetical protein
MKKRSMMALIAEQEPEPQMNDSSGVNNKPFKQFTVKTSGQ